jgi:hypothetical protein
MVLERALVTVPAWRRRSDIFMAVQHSSLALVHTTAHSFNMQLQQPLLRHTTVCRHHQWLPFRCHWHPLPSTSHSTYRRLVALLQIQ